MFLQRHSRSEKLLSEGRLKSTLDSNGEINNEDTLTKDDAEIANVSKVVALSRFKTDNPIFFFFFCFR